MAKNGLLFDLPGAAFTNPALPRIPDNYPLLNKGSLMLVDFGHSRSSPAAGVPGNGATITNLASKYAGKLLNVDPALTHPTMVRTDQATDMQFARTAKGGLQCVVSQVNDAANRYAILRAADALKNWVIANPDHDYYMHTIERIERPSIFTTGTQPAEGGIHAASSATANYDIIFQHGLIRPYPGQATFIGQRLSPGAPAVGLQFKNGAASAFAGNVPTLANLLFYLGWGNYSSFAGANLHKGRSSTLYQWYVEDLTASTLLYPDVDAAAFALYTKDWLTEGGRYYGDDRPLDPAAFL
jgi:hypothetical protein